MCNFAVQPINGELYGLVREHDDSSWRGAFAFKIMYHGAGWGHFNSGEWRVLGYDNDTRTWVAKTGDSYHYNRLYLWLQGRIYI